MGKNVSHEKYFEKEFSYYCPGIGCLYVKIPDAIMTGDRLAMMQLRGRSDEQKKPFDGIMVTPHGNLCLEFKYAYGKLRPHQMAWMEEINRINGSFFVLLKRELNTGSTYYIFKGGQLVHKNCSVKPVVQFLLEYAKTKEIPQDEVNFDPGRQRYGINENIGAISPTLRGMEISSVIIDEPVPVLRTERIKGEFKIGSIDTGFIANWRGMPVIAHDDEHYAVVVPKHWIDDLKPKSTIANLKMED
jgi:hypothetical protein